ncbi:MAG: diguanylate cyclase [Actinophytocola sp.]|uniref:GGDEF domain-containing protein n=1 Tax=Actinophytocola sp. TaxID=1872138 RepID=UPI0013225D45|nr:GGDEF domain-containing protein [Actinophytocola sp.]MPZ80541.1 diguanylate cyclase [Actinophytocola sp.]
MQNPGRQLEATSGSGVLNGVVSDLASQGTADDDTRLSELHETIASLLASRGEWRQAYEHLRHAFDLATAEKTMPPQVPQQFRLEVARLRREHAEAREQSIRDALTASYNRRYLDQRLLEVVAEQRGGASDGLAVALVDLDWFKSVNDTFGHLVGDRVLQQVVELLQVELPEGGFCARYGGEEFVLLLPGVDDATAVTVAEAARARVEAYPWSKIVLGLRVTVSIGVAHQPATGGHALTNPEQQLRSADGLLYTAKQSGRNAVAYRVGGEVRLSGAPVRRPR